MRWQQRKGEVAAALGIEGLESRLSMDSVDRGRGMPPRIALALKINCVRMAGFAGQREVPVTSSFAIHMCSSERVFHNPYAFFPSLVFYFSSCLSYCSLGFRRFSIVGLYFPTSTIGITTISYKKSINKLYYNSLNQNGTPCLYLQSKSNHMQDYLLLVF